MPEEALPGSSPGVTETPPQAGAAAAGASEATEVREQTQPDVKSPEAGADAASSEKPVSQADAKGEKKSDAPADGDVKPKTILEAAKRAIKSAAPPKASPGEKGTMDAKAPDAAPEKQKPTPEESWKDLREKVRASEDRAVAAEAELEKHKPLVEQMGRILEFQRKLELTDENMNDGLNLLGVFKLDPSRFLEAIQPYVDDAMLRTGKQLPRDLAERVERGEMSDEIARQVVRERLEKRELQAKAAKAETSFRTATEQREADRHGVVIQTVQTALTAWSTDQAAKDPQFQHLLPMVQERARALVMADPKQAAVDDASTKRLMDQALRDVKDRLKLMMGSQPRREVREVPSGAPGSGVAGMAKPKSLLEAAQLGLQIARS
jgi:hypothetical protein